MLQKKMKLNLMPATKNIGQDYNGPEYRYQQSRWVLADNAIKSE